MRLPKIIVVSDATYREIADVTGPMFRSTGTRLASGDWQVPIAPWTWDRLDALRLPGESDDQLLERLLRSHRGRKPS